MKDFSFSKAFKSLFSAIIINILISYFKLKGKKIIFFYHPKELLTSIHTFYVEDLFRDYHQNFLLISPRCLQHYSWWNPAEINKLLPE